MSLSAAAMICFLAAGCIVPQPRGEGELRRVTEPSTGRAYWLYLPKGLTLDAARQGERRPLVVSFHGMKPFDRASAQAHEWESSADRYGFIVVAPELRAPDLLKQFPVRKIDRAFESDERATLAILDHVIKTTPADSDRVLSTSWSSGGYLAHYMLNRHPDRFSCLAVRQSNFAASVLDSAQTVLSRNHPILLVSAENDFAICRREGKRAIAWYTEHEYTTFSSLVLDGVAHERTPEAAAEYFARVCGVASAPHAGTEYEGADVDRGTLERGRQDRESRPPFAQRLTSGVDVGSARPNASGARAQP